VRDLVEIGMGRGARRAYDLQQIEIVPSRRTRTSKEVSTAWQLDAYRFEIPLVTHPTDAIVSPATAVRVGQLGGLGVLNAEGLWARHADPAAVLARVVKAAEHEHPSGVVRLLQELHTAPIQPDLLAEALRQVREAGVTVAARVSPQRARELTPHLLAGGVEILFVQGTIISAEHVSTGAGEPLNLKQFINDLDVPVVTGGVGDYRTAMHLMRTGAAGVLVGYGESISTTTDAVLGIGVPMATAIIDAAAARRDYLDETGGRYVHVIADGGIYGSGDIAKAIACGADAVMLGEQLAEAQDAPAAGLYWTPAAAHPSLPRSDVVAAGVGQYSLQNLLFGPSDSPDGTVNLFGALRRAMAKTGYSDLKEFQRVGLTIRG
jgi:IMP dehydrogenase